MVRNALDHGVEPAAARLAAGKPAQATLALSARHEGGSVVILDWPNDELPASLRELGGK